MHKSLGLFIGYCQAVETVKESLQSNTSLKGAHAIKR